MTLKISNLYKHFNTPGGRKPVLNGIDLEIGPGEIFGLSGENGSGKTTLLKIIATLILPVSGGINVSGTDVLKRSALARRKISLVTGAEGSFYRMLSALDNIRFFARLYGLEGRGLQSRIDIIFSALGLDGAKDVKFSHLSSGARQKLAFARALLKAPEVLLIDEAYKSLDEASVERVSGLIRDTVRKTGAACIAVTHDSGWAARYCTALGKLAGGRIAASASEELPDEGAAGTRRKGR